MDFYAVEFPFSSERASTTDVAPLLFAEPYSARRARCATTRSVTHGSALRGHLTDVAPPAFGARAIVAVAHGV